MSKPKLDRAKIIQLVRTPLAFAVLVLLILEALIGIFALKAEGSDRTVLIIGMFVTTLFVVGLVFFMAIRFPELLGLDYVRTDKLEVIQNPRILFVTSKSYQNFATDKDLRIIEDNFPNAKIVREKAATSASFRERITKDGPF